MTACLVTDRLRLGTGQGFDSTRMRLVEQVRQAVGAGIELIQVRERDLDGCDLARLVGDILRMTRGTATRVVVNDRLDVACACGADGVHLRSDSFPAAEVRRVAPSPFLIGRSVHTVEDAARAGGVDYLIAGTVFATASKGQGHPLLGVDGLRAIAASTRVPVLAIGGIAADRIEAVARTGAAGVAGIGLFLEGASLPAVVSTVRNRFNSVRSAS